MIKIDGKGLKLLQEDIAKIQLTVPVEMRSHFRKAADTMKKEVVDTIQRGNSPVQGNGRFVDYSQGYKNAIRQGRYTGKLLRPVNLTLSGRMLKSLAARVTSRGFFLYFTSKLARIHSLEGPRGRADKIRKVAPYNGERWKTSVAKPAKDYLTKIALQKVISKLRRI